VLLIAAARQTQLCRQLSADADVIAIKSSMPRRLPRTDLALRKAGQSSLQLPSPMSRPWVRPRSHLFWRR